MSANWLENPIPCNGVIKGSIHDDPPPKTRELEQLLHSQSLGAIDRTLVLNNCVLIHNLQFSSVNTVLHSVPCLPISSLVFYSSFLHSDLGVIASTWYWSVGSASMLHCFGLLCIPLWGHPFMTSTKNWVFPLST